MKKYGKQIVSLLLVFALVACMLPRNMGNVKAAEQPATFTWSGCRADPGQYVIALTMSGATSGGDIYWSSGAALMIDGKRISDKNTINYIGGAAGTTNMTIVIQATALESDVTSTANIGTHTVVLESGTQIGEIKVANDIGFVISGQSITQKQVGTLKADALVDQGFRYMMQLKLEGANVAGNIYWEPNTILIDGKETSVNIDGGYGQTKNQLCFYPDYGTIQDGATSATEVTAEHLIEFPRGMHIGNVSTTGVNGIILKKSWWCKVQGSSITETVILEKEIVTLSDRPAFGSNDGKGFYFVTEPEDSAPYDSVGQKVTPFATGGAYIDGVLESDIQLKKILPNLWFVDLEVAGKTVLARQKVTIDGSVVTADKEIVFTPQTFIFTGNAWDVYEAPAEIQFTGIASGAWIEDQNRWLIYLNTDNIVPGTADSTRCFLDVWVDDVPIGQIGLYKSAGENNPLLLPLDASQLKKSDKQVKITICAATVDVTDLSTDDKYTVNFTNEFTFYLNPDGTFTTIQIKEGQLSLDTSSLNTSATGIDLATNYNIWSSELIGTHGWSNDPFPLEADGDSGVWLNDTQKLTILGHYLLKNYSDGKMYLWIRWDMLGKEGPEPGDKITVKGTYYRPESGCSYVRYRTFDIYWTGSKWTTTPLNKPGAGAKLIAGDANGDDILDSRDIVRIKRYLDPSIEEVVHTTNANADKDPDNKIDRKDLIKTYEYILEGEMKDGEYVKGSIPVYLDDVEISMFAFQGPRAAGGTNYTYKPDTTTLGAEKPAYFYKNTWGSKTNIGEVQSDSVSNSYLNAHEMQQYKDAGFTRLLPEGEAPWTNPAYFEMGPGMHAQLKYYMLLAQDAGLEVVVNSEAARIYLEDTGSATSGSSTDVTGDKIIETSEMEVDLTDLVQFMFKDNGSIINANWDVIFSGHPEYKAYEARMRQHVVFDNFVGIQLSDEILAKAGNDTQKKSNLLTKYNNVVTKIKSLMASYGKNAVCVSTSASGNVNPSDIQEMAQGSGMFLYNAYPFGYKTESESKSYKNYFYRGTKTLDTTWFDKLSSAAQATKGKNYAAGVTLQAFAMDNPVGEYALAPIESPAEMSWQIYTALAYGMKELNYFEYWEGKTQAKDGERHYLSMVEYPDEPNATGAKSQKTATYGYVQQVNQEIKKFDHVFMDFDWLESVKQDTAANSVKVGSATFDVSGSGSALISEMIDSEKDKLGYWIVNATNPIGTSVTETVTAHFAGATHVMTWIDGKQSLVKLATKGEYTTTVAIGEGQFMIPLTLE